MINTHNGYVDSIGNQVPRINVNDYPAIKKHLDKYWEKLEKRYDKGDTPYNLRNCAYMEDFGSRKILYSEIVKKPQFFLDEYGKFYPEATAFLITGTENLRNLLFFLNSSIVTFFFKRFYAGGGLGKEGIRFKKAFLEKLPLPRIQFNIFNEEELIKIFDLNDEEFKFIQSQ